MFVFAMYQAKIQKHQAFEAEVAAHANAIQVLDQTGNEMIGQQHFASETIRVRPVSYTHLTLPTSSYV